MKSTTGIHNCPVCGKHVFEEEDSYDICPVCGWTDERFQEMNPDEWGGGNRMSLNMAKEAYKKGERVY